MRKPQKKFQVDFSFILTHSHFHFSFYYTTLPRLQDAISFTLMVQIPQIALISFVFDVKSSKRDEKRKKEKEKERERKASFIC